MAKYLLWGDIYENAGPSNVHRELVNLSNGELDYVKNRNTLLKYLELFVKILFSDVVIYPTNICARKNGGIIRFIDIFIFKLLKKKQIGLFHGCLGYENKINNLGWDQEIIERQEDYVLDSVDLIVCVSERFCQWTKERFPKYSSKITFVNNGLELNFRKRTQKDSMLIALTGGNRKIKNNDNVCLAVNNLIQMGYECRVKVFGDYSDDGDDLKKYSFVDFEGILNKDDFYAKLDCVSLLVLASELESFGLVVGDALNCNCSLLMSSNVGALSIMETDENDIIFNPHDIDELARKILYLFENPNIDRLRNSVNIYQCSNKKSWENLKLVLNS